MERYDKIASIYSSSPICFTLKTDVELERQKKIAEHFFVYFGNYEMAK